MGKTLTAQNIKFEDAHVNFTEDIFYSEEKEHIALYFQHGLVFSQFPKFKALKTLPATFFSDSADIRQDRGLLWPFCPLYS